MKKITLIMIILSIAACSSSGYRKFYHPYVTIDKLPNPERLAEGELPKVYGTNDFEKDIRTLRAKKYVVLGYSSFNGAYEDTKHAQVHGKAIGATLILVNSKYTNTLTTTSTLFLPDNKTTYYSGNINTNTNYNTSYGSYGNINTSASYTGTSTTYDTKAVPITTHQQRYDQTAVFMVKFNPKMKFGVNVIDLSEEMRSKHERNTGAFVDLVFEESAAFYSNVLPGDIIISVDGTEVLNTKHAQEVMARVPPYANKSTLVVLRNGAQKEIVVKFK